MLRHLKKIIFHFSHMKVSQNLSSLIQFCFVCTEIFRMTLINGKEQQRFHACCQGHNKGSKVNLRGFRGAFVTYCNISCWYFDLHTYQSNSIVIIL